MPNKIATPLASPNDDKLDCLFTLEAAVPTTAAAVVVDLLVDLPIVPLLVFELLAMIVFSAAPLLCTGGMIIRIDPLAQRCCCQGLRSATLPHCFVLLSARSVVIGVAVALQYGCKRRYHIIVELLQVSFRGNCIVGCRSKVGGCMVGRRLTINVSRESYGS